ncbi:arylesterase [Pelagicoccus sp. SDUM812003]|uniref:arylesterase n=1 Tax=Pelagicoccus sp. SDUM812003 TaxID=3041267 RepID=UPI00280E3CE7|nr:arylesterase [Pelagicoccus sp. SDUM812003]MDQ8201817.1 arylesterase [Pelagicoccus sp. SDUM812003]
MKSTHTLLSSLLLLVFTLSGGCARHDKIDTVDRSTKILAFGDSLTSGVGAESEYSYPSILSELLNCEIENYGISGEDTTAGLARLPKALEETRPDLVLLCYGGNDMLRKQPTEQTKSNLEKMITLIKAQGADIVLIGVPKPGLTLSVPDLYQDLADQYSLPLEKDSIRRIIQTPSLKSDKVHPNAAGYKVMAESIHQLIIESSSRD